MCHTMNKSPERTELRYVAESVPLIMQKPRHLKPRCQESLTPSVGGALLSLGSKVGVNPWS